MTRKVLAGRQRQEYVVSERCWDYAQVCERGAGGPKDVEDELQTFKCSPPASKEFISKLSEDDKLLGAARAKVPSLEEYVVCG